MKLLEGVGAVGPKTEQRIMALTGPQVDKARALCCSHMLRSLPQHCRCNNSSGRTCVFMISHCA